MKISSYAATALLGLGLVVFALGFGGRAPGAGGRAKTGLAIAPIPARFSAPASTSPAGAIPTLLPSPTQNPEFRILNSDIITQHPTRGTLRASAPRSPHSVCRALPIGVQVHLVEGVAPGAVISDSQRGPLDGSFVWLALTGDVGDSALAAGLRQPLVFPTGDQLVPGRGPVDNDPAIKSALTALVATHSRATVPLWDDSNSDAEAGPRYHLAGYASVTLLDFRLSAPNTITIQYWSRADCGQP